MVSGIFDYLYVVLLRGEYRMKVEINDNKPVFKPITITMETAQEFFSILAALGLSSDDKEIERLNSYGVSISKAGYKSDAAYLHGTLCQYFDKVKETL